MIPNRAAQAAATFNQHRDLLGSDDSRRGILYFICRDLNREFGDFWGVLTKTDQGDFIPSDVIVWHPTLEWVDVINGTTKPESPMWDAHEPIANPAWVWTNPDVVKPVTAPPAPSPVPPVPPPVPLPPPDPGVLTGAEVLAQFLDSLERIAAGVEAMARTGLAISEQLGKDQARTIRFRP